MKKWDNKKVGQQSFDEMDFETRRAICLTWWRGLSEDGKKVICDMMGEDFDIVKNSSSKIERVFRNFLGL